MIAACTYCMYWPVMSQGDHMVAAWTYCMGSKVSSLSQIYLYSSYFEVFEQNSTALNKSKQKFSFCISNFCSVSLTLLLDNFSISHFGKFHLLNKIIPLSKNENFKNSYRSYLVYDAVCTLVCHGRLSLTFLKLFFTSPLLLLSQALQH